MEHERILQALYRLIELQEQTNLLLSKERSAQTPREIKWIGELEAQKILNSSRTTLYRHRRDGILNYIHVGSRCYYDADQLLGLRDKYMK